MIEQHKASYEENRDPITKEPGSHPLGTGMGAIGAGLTGAAVGTALAGPLGGAIGSLVGGILGGLGGHALAESVDPTAEDAYWREHHKEQPFADPSSDDFEQYAPAYRTGYLGYSVYGEQRDFDQAEEDLRASYEASRPDLPWELARPAIYVAWERVNMNSPLREEDAIGEAINNPTMTDDGKPAQVVGEGHAEDYELAGATASTAPPQLPVNPTR